MTSPADPKSKSKERIILERDYAAMRRKLSRGSAEDIAEAVASLDALAKRDALLPPPAR